MTTEIVLAAGTHFVATADVPELIALALHPDESGPHTLSYLIKRARPGSLGVTAEWDGRPIDEDDWRELLKIWAGLPAMPRDATQEQVQPYLDAFETNGADLDWQIEPVWTNPKLKNVFYRVQTEDDHRGAITREIRAGRLKVTSPISRVPTDELHPASEMSVEELRRYLAQFQIALRFSDPTPEGITLQDLALEIARIATEHYADQWSKPGGDNGRRAAIAAAINVHGWQPDGIPGVLRHLRNMVEFGQIAPRSCFNGLPPTDPDEIMANPANWLLSNEHAEFVRKALEVEANRPKPAPDGYTLRHYESEFGENNSERWTREQWNKVASEVNVHSETLLTIGDAANLVGHKYGWHDGAIKTLCKQMMAAAGKTLTVRHPHTDLPYEPQRVSWYYELVRADDLDAWFSSQKVDMRIQPEPDEDLAKAVLDAAASATKPVQRSQAQENFILQEIRGRGFNPLQLPVPQRGVAGIKSEIREVALQRRDLFQSLGVFGKAWDRLRATEQIRDVQRG